MTQRTSTATEFANAIVNGQLDDAHKMLTAELARQLAPADLSAEYERLADDMGGVTGVGPAQEILQDWPDKADNEVSMVYVTLAGESWSEAITVTLAEVEGVLCISNIEWGRP